MCIDKVLETGGAVNTLKNMSLATQVASGGVDSSTWWLWLTRP